MTDYKFTVDWFSSHIPFWNQCLDALSINRNDPLDILEVGSFEGKSTTWIAENLLNNEQSSLLCIDTFEGGIEHREGSTEHKKWEHLDTLYDMFLHNTSVCKNSDKIKVRVGDSQVVLPELNKAGRQFDIIYIDGSHETEHVFNDGINSFEMLKPGGLIIFDDYEWSLNGVQTVKAALIALEEKLPDMKWIISGWQRAYLKDTV
jgi:predicted O-methyltransferase YrrM